MIKSNVLIGFSKDEQKEITRILNKILPYSTISTLKTLKGVQLTGLERESIFLIRYKVSKKLPVSSQRDLLRFPVIIVSETYPPFPEALPSNLLIIDYIQLNRLEQDLKKSIMKVEHLMKSGRNFSETVKNIERAKIEWERSVDSLHDLIFILDKNFTIKRINMAVTNYIGKKFTDIIGEKCYALLYNNKRPCKVCPLKTYIKENKIKSVIKQHYNEKNKNIFRVEITPLLPETPNVQFVVKLTNNTEEFYIKKFFLSLLLMAKKTFTQESMRSLYRRFFLLLSKWSGFKRGILIMENKEFYHFGYKKDAALILKDIFYKVVKQERIAKKLNENFYYVLYQDEIENIKDTGIVVPLKWIIFPLHIKGKIKGYILLDTPFEKQWFEMAIEDGIKLGIDAFTKIVNNVELRNKLFTEERKLHYLIENLREGVVYLNKQKQVIHINSSGKRMMHRIINDWNGTKVKKMGNLSIARLLKDSDGEIVIPKEIIGNDGRVYSILSAVVKNKEKEETIGYVLTIRDITKNKQYTEDLMTTFQMASLGEITAEIAHEINNPLTAIIGLSELLVKENVSPAIKEKLRVIRTQGKRVSSTVQALLMSSKKRDFGEFDLNQVIIRTLKLIKHPYYLASIDIKFAPYKERIKCWGDPNLIEIVVLNMLKNAKEAITPLKKKGKITIKTYKRNTYGIFTIVDNGPGIPEKVKDKVMETFFSTKQAELNLGIGLSICKRIVDMHKGRIKISSRPEKGTKFTVQIPLAAKKPTTLLFKQPASMKEKKIKDIFIIDDEKVILSVMKEMLENYGYRVDTTTSPIKGIQMIKEKIYDIVFLDIKMPEMDGRDVYYNIVKDVPNNVKKVVFFTGDTVSADIQRFLSEVRAPYLRKPFTEKDILKLLEENDEKQT